MAALISFCLLDDAQDMPAAASSTCCSCTEVAAVAEGWFLTMHSKDCACVWEVFVAPKTGFLQPLGKGR